MNNKNCKLYVTRWIVHTETSRINGKFTNFFARIKIDRFYPPFDLFSKNPRSRYFWRANIEKKFLYSSLLQRYMDRRSIDKQRSKILHYEMDSLSLFWPTSKLSPNPKFLALLSSLFSLVGNETISTGGEESGKIVAAAVHRFPMIHPVRN